MSVEETAPLPKTLSPADLFALALTKAVADRAKAHFQASAGMTARVSAETAQTNVIDIDRYVRAHADDEDNNIYGSMVTTIHHAITMQTEQQNGQSDAAAHPNAS